MAVLVKEDVENDGTRASTFMDELALCLSDKTRNSFMDLVTREDFDSEAVQFDCEYNNHGNIANCIKDNQQILHFLLHRSPKKFDFTSLEKMNANLRKYKLSQTTRNGEFEFVILLTTGSLNPIHLGHTDILEAAKKNIEKKYQNMKIIAGFMSPSHDCYLESKYGKCKFIPSQFRVKMVKMAAADSEWIACDEWECQQDGFTDFCNVHSTMEAKMRKIYCNENKIINPSKLRVLYVCGMDGFNNQMSKMDCLS